MPLPERDQEWPPPHTRPALKCYEVYGAWYSGDTSKLAGVYQTAAGAASGLQAGDLKVYDDGGRTGLRGIVHRFFHGTTESAGTRRSPKLHIPLASDIASTSADLLFSEPPKFLDAAVAEQRKKAKAAAASAKAKAKAEPPKPDPTDPLAKPPEEGPDDGPPLIVKASATQERLDQYMEEGLQAVLMEGAETAAAYGGVYLRVGWHKAVADQVIWDVIPPDAAVPEFAGTYLTAVTFWRVLDRESGAVWRHLERHEPGKIYHGLYKGTDDKLGRQMALADRPETAPFAELVGEGGYVETGATGLAAEYIPNMRPNRGMRGSPLGRSDFDGIEPVFDSLDETWTSLMRDLRLGKSRLVVPRAYLQNLGRGQGAVFDADRELYEALDALPNQAGGMELTQVQFTIRVTEHLELAKAQTAQAVRGAGYSVQTFGEGGTDLAVTATEVVARERRSYTTRGRKITYWRSPLARLAFAALEIDIKQFGPDGVKAQRPLIEWPDGVAVDPEQQARTIQMLQAAETASIQTRLEMLHPDWEDDRIQEEVIRIKEESSAGVPDPLALGADPREPGDDGPPEATKAPNGSTQGAPARPKAALPGR